MTDAVIIADQERMVPYGKDGTVGAFAMPELVVEVKNSMQVQTLLRLAKPYCFPVIPRGLGTGLAGGVILSLAGMNRILAIEPGVLDKDFKEAVQAQGLTTPP